MSKTKQRYLSILLVFALCLGLTVSALASDEPGEDVSAAEAEASAVCETSEEAEEPAVETPAEEPAQDGETGYSLWIMGKQVTSGNKNDVLGNGSGTDIVDKSGSLAKVVIINTGALPGDADGNGYVQPADAALVLGAPASCDQDAADVSGSNTVDPMDAAMILQYCAGILAGFPAG